MAPWPCYFLFCTLWMAIHWLWIAASKSLTNYRIYRIEHYGGSIDAWGVAALTQTILPIKAANTSNMGKCCSTALGLYKMQHTKLLTLCWHSFWGVTVSTNTILPIKAANTSIMDKCRSTALELYKMQHTKSLTLCWRSFSDRCCDHVTIAFAQNGCQYVDFRHMP